MSYKIQEIEGIGPTYADKLAGANIVTTTDLLDLCAKPAGRKKVANDCDISEKLVLEWANQADLMRIKGVGEEYADLLEAAGVDTVKELRNRNVANLTAKMIEVNDEKNLVRAVPSESQVEKWVAEAKELPPILEY